MSDIWQKISCGGNCTCGGSCDGNCGGNCECKNKTEMPVDALSVDTTVQDWEQMKDEAELSQKWFQRSITASIKGLVATLKDKYPGLLLWASESSFNNTVVLDKIVVPQQNRRQGIATEVINAILSWADQNGKVVALTPDESLGTSKSKLVSMYKQFGFVMNKGRNKDYEISELMYRPLSGKKASLHCADCGCQEEDPEEDGDSREASYWSEWS